jgi:hypothetical protein
MTPAWLFAMCLIGPQPGLGMSAGFGAERELLAAAASADAAPPNFRNWSAEQWRQVFRSAMQRSAAPRRPAPAEVVPELAGLYLALQEADPLGASERSRYRQRVRQRLEQLRDDLLREEARQRHGRKPATAPGGAAVPAGAQQLIALIQAVIEPDSWAVNGGRGTIMFLPGWNVLVIRQTGEVHRQVRDALDQLRR